MFCEKCGTDVKENLFCPQCGAGTAKPSVLPPQENKAALTENTAGLLCYILGWVTGVVFILIDKRPFVRFHAMQSIVVFGGLSVFSFLFSRVISVLPYTLWRILSGINTIISLGGIVLAIFLILQAYQGKQYKLPAIGDIAERLSKNG